MEVTVMNTIPEGSWQRCFSQMNPLKSNKDNVEIVMDTSTARRLVLNTLMLGR
jgi:hypothetical protein